MQYKICSYCGCNLDHGERCDCRDEKDEDNDASIEPEKPEIREVARPA